MWQLKTLTQRTTSYNLKLPGIFLLITRKWVYCHTNMKQSLYTIRITNWTCSVQFMTINLSCIWCQNKRVFFLQTRWHFLRWACWKKFTKKKKKKKKYIVCSSLQATVNFGYNDTHVSKPKHPCSQSVTIIIRSYDFRPNMHIKPLTCTPHVHTLRSVHWLHVTTGNTFLHYGPGIRCSLRLRSQCRAPRGLNSCTPCMRVAWVWSRCTQ